jgi:hypothetical protein
MTSGLDCTAISGETNSTYDVDFADEGKKIRVKVTGTNGSGSSSAYSAASGVVTVPTFTLSVTKSGTGSGSVASSPAGIDCGSSCDYDYDYDTDVVLNAAADTGSTFSGWSGAGCSGTGTCEVTLTQARAVDAEFRLAAPPNPGKPTAKPIGKPGGRFAKVKVGCGSASACTLKITGKLKGGNGRVVPKTVLIGGAMRAKAGTKRTVRVRYSDVLKRELSAKGRGKIFLKVREVGGKTTTIYLKVALPTPVTG